MAVTRLADLYNPLVFDDSVDEEFVELNAFLRSGVMTPYDKLSAMAQVGGMIGEMPFFKPLDTNAEPDYTNDDPAVTSTPDKITTGKQIYRLAKMHNSWSTMDFARELTVAGMDPLAAITRKVAKYWAIQEERRLVAAALGVLNDNAANDSGDMIHDIYTDVASPASTALPSAEALLDTKQTAGDHQGMFSAVAMHSVTFNALNKANLIDFIPNSDGRIDFPTYLNLAVVVDDNMPVIAGTNSPAYITAIFATSAFGYGQGRAEVPSEIERVASSGNGGGQDILHSRRNDIIHPTGFQFTSASVANETATIAELKNATNWDRVIDRKLCGLAFLKHNN